MKKRNKVKFGLAAVTAYFISCNPIPSITRGYVPEIIKEMPVVVSDWVSDNGYQKNADSLLADFHMHFLTPERYGGIENIVYKMMERVDIVAVTDRTPENVPERTMSFDQFKEAADSLGSDYEVESDSQYVKITKDEQTLYVVRGQEVMTAQDIEILIIGSTEQFDKGIDIDELLEGIEAVGGFSIMAHPYAVHRPLWQGRFVLPNKDEEEDRIKYAQRVTAIEEFNSQNTWFGKSLVGANVLASQLSYYHGIRGVANSDGHYKLDNIGLSGTVFSKDGLDVSTGKTLIKSIERAIISGDYGLHTEYNNPVNFGISVGFQAVKEALF